MTSHTLDPWTPGVGRSGRTQIWPGIVLPPALNDNGGVHPLVHIPIVLFPLYVSLLIPKRSLVVAKISPQLAQLLDKVSLVQVAVFFLILVFVFKHPEEVAGFGLLRLPIVVHLQCFSVPKKRVSILEKVLRKSALLGSGLCESFPMIIVGYLLPESNL